MRRVRLCCQRFAELTIAHMTSRFRSWEFTEIGMRGPSSRSDGRQLQCRRHACNIGDVVRHGRLARILHCGVLSLCMEPDVRAESKSRVSKWMELANKRLRYHFQATTGVTASKLL
jgi:hypothetical protein